MLDLIANQPFPVKEAGGGLLKSCLWRRQVPLLHPWGGLPKYQVRKQHEPGDFPCLYCGAVAELMQPQTKKRRYAPVPVYGITKLAQEQMALTVGRALGISTVALRYQNVYGPGQSLLNPYTGILSIFSTHPQRQRNKHL
ncbi:MAG: NAD-dependent epimerase/dehydratase family protein [Lewinellaceae bacterium]|nr:NAD-dependent epimerase/dehydratase family protein [Lewinellaceae bacterium]